MMTKRIELYDDQWCSKPIIVEGLVSVLRDYVHDCCEGNDLARGLRVLDESEAPRNLSEAVALVGRVNTAIESGSNGLVVREAAEKISCATDLEKDAED